MRLIIALGLIMIANWAAADIYKSVDKDGQVIYTDSPRLDNAKKVELKEINTVPGAEPIPSSTAIGSFDTQMAELSYQISIISPKTEVVIPPGQRDLVIGVTVEPPLRPDHLLVYFLNGELIEETKLNNVVVKDVPRGTHSLVVEAITSDGQSLGTSAPVTVNIIRPIKKKRVNPAPRPL